MAVPAVHDQELRRGQLEEAGWVLEKTHAEKMKLILGRKVDVWQREREREIEEKQRGGRRIDDPMASRDRRTMRLDISETKQ